jgi:histone chaperone ASF1
VVYVGSAEDQQDDQVLEEVMVGPVPVGVNRFILQAASPNVARIRNEDLIGVTVLLITCSYKDNKFVQIGYYVNNEYAEPIDPENPPNPVDVHKLFRNLLADQPRVTRYAIDWTGTNEPPTSTDDAQEVQAIENDDDDVSMR